LARTKEAEAHDKLSILGIRKNLIINNINNHESIKSKGAR
jgi:hypothetical protein